MKNILLMAIYMLSKYFLYGFVIQLLFLNFGLATSAKGQYKSIEEVTVRISNKQLTIGQFFKEVQRQTSFKFSYDSKKVDRFTLLTFEHTKGTVEDFLKEASKQSILSFRQYNNSIDVLKDDQRVVASILAEDPITITGTVTDENGEAIPGVTVSVPDTGIGTATDLDGNYSLTAPEGSTLVFSFIGFETQSIAVGDRSVIDVTLSEDVASLDEVVVVGYGAVERKDLTGAIGSINNEDIKELAVTRVDQALLGKIAGVQVKPSSGAPGAAPEILIRGVGSMSAGSNPLYVVDGFPVSDLQTINPDNIESIDILKDASSTAIYGSRGSNGVVIITTKRGQSGIANITFDASVGWQKISKKPVYMNAEEQALSAYWGAYNRNVDIGAPVTGDPRTWQLPVPQLALDYLEGKTTPTESEIYGTTMPDTDWLDLVTHVAPVKTYQLSASGGSDKVKYAISGEYLNQDGIVINTNFKRYSLQANIDGQLSKRLAVKLNLNPSFTASFGGDPSGTGYGTGAISNANAIPAYTPAYAPDGDYFVLSGYEETGNYPNALALANEVIDDQREGRFRGNILTEYTILDELKFNIMLGGSFFSDRRRFFQPQLPAFLNASPIGEEWTSFGFRWINEYTLNYDKRFGDHHIVGLAGFTAEKRNVESNYLSSNAFPNNLVPYMSATGGILNDGTSTLNEWSLVSYLARINYSYGDKYYLTASVRTDGSSRFGSEERYGVFPSGALAWRISDEDFLQDLSSLSNLKFRASYGQTGNNNIGDYAALATVTNVTYPRGNSPAAGFVEARIHNPFLTWEKQSSFDFGLDAGFFRDRLSLTVDYFKARNEGLLLNVNIPTITGFSTALQNIGEVENKGWEFAVSSVNLTRKLQWSTDFNISTYKNKVLALGTEDDPIISNHHKTEVGESMGMFYGLVMDGIFETTAELAEGPIYNPGAPNRTRVGDIKFKDFSGPEGVPDGIINSYDRVYMGSPHPDFFYGMTNRFSYQNFSLSVSLQGVVGNEIYSLVRVTSLRSSYRRKILGEGNDFWISEEEPGDGNTPRQNDEPSGGIREASSLFLEDGTYLRVNNITLSYTVPNNIAQKLTLNSVRIYVNATNPFTFSNTSGFNPDVTRPGNALTPGEDFNQYPLAKSLELGLNVSF
jgi:TonB-linked SusC/RagA family outer membrane protein